MVWHCTALEEMQLWVSDGLKPGQHNAPSPVRAEQSDLTSLRIRSQSREWGVSAGQWDKGKKLE